MMARFVRLCLGCGRGIVTIVLIGVAFVAFVDVERVESSVVRQKYATLVSFKLAVLTVTVCPPV